LIYLPVMPTLLKYKHGWWNSQSPFKYPYIFASFLSQRNYPNLRQEFSIEDDVVVFCDSGGYSTFSRGATVDPYELADFYNTAKVDVGISLDFPPYVDARKKDIADFESNLELTVRSTKILYDRTRAKLYATIHGTTHEQYETWRQSVDMIGDFAGYAIGISPINNPTSVLQAIRYLEKIKNEKPIHFFETGSALCFLLLARYSKLRGISITTDSSYASTAGQAVRLYMTTFGKLVAVGAKQEGAFKNTPACMCPVCTRYGSKEVINDTELLTLHNTYLLLWRYKFLDSIATDKPETFKQLIPEAVEYIKQLDAVVLKSGKLTWEEV
jgi:tRNA-guanine family transglycosylase